MGKLETVADFIFLSSKITADGDCSHEIKRRLPLGRKVMANLDSILEKAMATHSSTLAWKIPWTKGPGRLQSMGSLGVGHDWATSPSLFTFMHWRRKWQPTLMFLPGESQGRGARWAAIYGVAQSRIWLKQLSSSSRQYIKKQRHYMPTKVCLVKAMVFLVVMYGCESWTVKKAECQRIDVLNYGVGEDSWESLGL